MTRRMLALLGAWGTVVLLSACDRASDTGSHDVRLDTEAVTTAPPTPELPSPEWTVEPAGKSANPHGAVFAYSHCQQRHNGASDEMILSWLSSIWTASDASKPFPSWDEIPEDRYFPLRAIAEKLESEVSNLSTKGEYEETAVADERRDQEIKQIESKYKGIWFVGGSIVLDKDSPLNAWGRQTAGIVYDADLKQMKTNLYSARSEAFMLAVANMRTLEIEHEWIEWVTLRDSLTSDISFEIEADEAELIHSDLVSVIEVDLVYPFVERRAAEKYKSKNDLVIGKILRRQIRNICSGEVLSEVIL